MEKPTKPKTIEPVEKSYEPGEVLFKEGDHSTSMFVIKEGVVAIRKQRRNSYVEVAKLHSKEVLGELSFFDRGKRSATAVAVTAVRVLVIEFESLDKVYAQVPPYIKTIMTAVADRLRKANEQIKRMQHAETVATELAEVSQDQAKLAELSSQDDPEKD